MARKSGMFSFQFYSSWKEEGRVMDITVVSGMRENIIHCKEFYI
jgi:hypothetical protein